MNEPDPRLDAVAAKVLDAAFAVHRALGPGLLESIYSECLKWDLEDRGCDVETEVGVPISYRGRVSSNRLRLDLLVENAVIVEVKSCEATLRVHKSQLLSYLRLSGYQLGLLINFNVPSLREGITRIVHSSR